MYYIQEGARQLGMQHYVPGDPGHKVIDGIYIGSLNTAVNEEYLRMHNIGYIINLSGRPYDSKLPVYPIIMDDTIVTITAMDDYISKFAGGVAAITRARAVGKNVLIHCAAGINRSATLIGMYLINNGFSYEQVLSLIKKANDCRGVPCLTNPSFRTLLRAQDSFVRNFRYKSFI